MGMAPYGEPKYVDKVQQALHARARRQLVARHGLLLLPPLDDADLQQQVHRAVRRAARPRLALLHRAARASRPYFGDQAVRLRRASPSATSTTPTSPPASSTAPRRSSSPWRARCTPRPASTSCAWPAAWRSTASPTAASCARRRSRELFVQPAAGDGGGALGAALFAYHCVLGQPRCVPHGTRLLGQGLHATPRSATSCASASIAHTRCAQRGPAARPRRRPPAPGARRRLVPGPLRVGAARARRAQHHRRSRAAPT